MVVGMMNKTSNTVNLKRGRGRPKKIVQEFQEDSSNKTVGLPTMLIPTEHDIREELSMLDSYSYSRYNE